MACISTVRVLARIRPGHPVFTMTELLIHTNLDRRWAVSLAAFFVICVQAFAQIPDAAMAGQNRPDQVLPLANRPSQDRFCTPAEYGDPMADCIPAPARYGSSPYAGVDEFGRTADLDGRDVNPYALPNVSVPSDLSNYSPRNTPPPRYEREPVTEFERYIATAVGQPLSIYGSSLFEKVPATFAPLDRAPVSADYIIAPGDELQIVVWGQFNFSRRLIVTRTGELILPDAGPVAVAGLRYAEAAAVLKSSLMHFYKNFDLSVTLGRLHSVQIFVVGEARRPGSYTVSALSTLVNAVFASGGPSARGSMRRIELKRNGETIRQFDLYDLLVKGDKSKDAPLYPGDVVFIHPVGPQVAIAGSVGRPGIYELKRGTTLGEVLHFADGLSPVAARKQIVLDRVAEGSALKVLRISLDDAGLSTELRNGDIIRVLALVPRFDNAVTLRGNVADAARVPWHAGMRISELIPNKEALITRDYWRERNHIYATADAREEDFASTDHETTQSSQPLSASLSNRGVNGPFDGVPVAYHDQPRNAQGDASFGAATSISGIAPMRTFAPRNTIEPSAPDIDWDYASVERTDPSTLATTIIPFRLGKLVLSQDSSQDLELEPGDVVTIFSKADFSIPRAQQPKQVRLEGEVAMAGVYTVLPGERLRNLITRAGGLTSSAYLYGAQFTRESTRREQQKRYDDFVSQFEREVNEEASNLSSRVTSTQQAATAETSVASQRGLVERLRTLKMDGRIVLDVLPHSHGVDALPDLPLENGDRLYVPSRPSTANVIGSVFEQSSFLYDEDLRVGDYLQKAGGPAHSADRGHMFIIRADGSVVSRTSHSGPFAKNFDSLPMYPGDTLVVPTSINKTTFLRGFMDWSQIFSNLTLGAAAVSVLH